MLGSLNLEKIMIGLWALLFMHPSASMAACNPCLCGLGGDNPWPDSLIIGCYTEATTDATETTFPASTMNSPVDTEASPEESASSAIQEIILESSQVKLALEEVFDYTSAIVFQASSNGILAQNQQSLFVQILVKGQTLTGNPVKVLISSDVIISGGGLMTAQIKEINLFHI